MDQVPAPPPVEVFDSPSGTYRFTLRAPADWQTGAPEGELVKTDGSGSKRLWRQALPQEYRARFALVTDRGLVVMLDDWWNVRSGYAVMLVGPDGEEVAVWRYDDVQATLGVPISELVAKAKHGPWISAPPQLDVDGIGVLVPAAGKHLVIDTARATLTAQP